MAVSIHLVGKVKGFKIIDFELDGKGGKRKEICPKYKTKRKQKHERDSSLSPPTFLSSYMALCQNRPRAGWFGPKKKKKGGEGEDWIINDSRISSTKARASLDVSRRAFVEFLVFFRSHVRSMTVISYFIRTQIIFFVCLYLKVFLFLFFWCRMWFWNAPPPSKLEGRNGKKWGEEKFETKVSLLKLKGMGRKEGREASVARNFGREIFKNSKKN